MLDKLETLLNLQHNLAKELDSPRYPVGVAERVSALSTAIIHESVELQRLTNWKWWKKTRQFDIELARGELIDIWHFLLQATLELDMTADDLLKYYTLKNKINLERKKSNY
jgi:dimeric dUTPase (all-alpha-NTP-PPase superfamily)